MQEIEVKILEIDKEAIISKLEKLWAKLIFDWDIENDFYVNQENRKIRLRKKWNKNILTFKIRQENTTMKSNMEYEVEFKEYENMGIILENIWFQKFADSRKKRISYQLDTIVFDIDDFPGIPTFIEVEAQNTEDVMKWVELLWYEMKDTCTLAEKGLKEFYGLI